MNAEIKSWHCDKENAHWHKVVGITIKKMRVAHKVVGESVGCAQSSRQGVALEGFTPIERRT
jgi:hypothetical protein